jgi:hypothetical protein
MANVEQRKASQYERDLKIKERVLIKNRCPETAEQNDYEQNKAQPPNG